MTTTWQAQPHTDAEPEDIKHHLPLHSQDFSLSLSLVTGQRTSPYGAGDNNHHLACNNDTKCCS